MALRDPVVFYTAWFLETHQARFLLSTAPLICLIMAAGVEWLMHGHGKPVQVLTSAALVLGILGTGWLFDKDDQALLATRWPFLTGAETREDFLSANVPGYTVFDYANEALPENSLVWLALYEVRGYYLDRDYAWANPISQRYLPLERYTDAQALAADLRPWDSHTCSSLPTSWSATNTSGTARS